MRTCDEYRALAQEHRANAEQSRDRILRNEYIKLAEAYEALARNEAWLAGETRGQLQAAE
jgi:hypothetical protein